MLFGHELPRVRPNGLRRSFANEQQAEGKRLREGGGEQGVELAAITAGLRMSVEYIPELVADDLQRSVLRTFVP